MFGFGKGKIEIQLNNFNYAPGETVEGTLSLSLKKPILGKELSISLLAEEEVTEMQGNNYNSRTHELFYFKQHLSGQKEYSFGNQSYPFKIKIPVNLRPQLNATLEKVIKIASLFSGKRGRITWYLVARLDVKGFDITKKIAIHVG